jgi:hypothetical protein
MLDRDCKDALSAMELVLSQSGISSQLFDNLNASIHLHALLSDLFLIYDIAKLAGPRLRLRFRPNGGHPGLEDGKARGHLFEI